MITEPGIYFDMRCEDYFADPCPTPSLSNSGIGILLRQSPAHFAAQHPRLTDSPDACQATAAMHRGSVVHRLALGAGKDYEIIDFDDYRKNDAKAQRAEAEANGLVPILRAKFDEAEAQAKVVRHHLDELLLGEAFIPEAVIAWQIETPHGPVWCRGMMDAWCPTLNLIVDLKSTTDASAATLTRRMAAGGYDTQAAWYPRGLGQILDMPGRIRFATLFCETDAPHCSQAVELDEAWRSSAWDLCEEAIEIFARCSKAGKWPGYPRTTQLLSPPDWLIRDRMYRGFARDGHEALNDELPADIAAE